MVTDTDIVTNIDNEGEVADVNNIVTVHENEVEVTNNIVTATDIDNEVEATDIVTVNKKEETPPCPVISEAALPNGQNDEMDLLLSEGAACHEEIPQPQEVDLLTSEPEEPVARSSDVENIGGSGENRTSKYLHQDFISDIDLADPAVEAAATKIQSAFKGYKTRKKIENNSQ